MATAYLTAGVTDLTSANWSDTTGFANGAQLVINQAPTTEITGSLNQSGVSIESLDIVGNQCYLGAAGSPLITDVDGTAYSEPNQISRIRARAKTGRVYFNAGGGNTLAHIIQVGGGMEFFFVAGIVNFVVVEEGGRFVGNQTVTYGDTGRFDLTGGTSYIDTHASDLIGAINASAGNHTIKRGGVAATGRLTIGGTANITLDCSAGAWPEIYMEAGTLKWISSGAPDTNAGDVTIRGGTIDFTDLNRPLTITNARISPSVNIIGRDNKFLTLTTPYFQGGSGTGLNK